MHRSSIAVIAVLLVGGAPAWAQQAPASKAVSDVGRDWTLLNGAIEHAANSVSALVKEATDLRAERDALKAEVEKLKKPAEPPKGK